LNLVVASDFHLHVQCDPARAPSPPLSLAAGLMTEIPPKIRPNTSGKPPAPPTIPSQDLLAGHREVIIQHGHEQYRLQLTNSNKLILVK
jgi:hemin uptake protein HemP